VSTLDDLAGKEVFVRKSSSYYESLVTLNTRFAAEKKPLIKLKEAPEELEDEDLIEMLNAGLVSTLVVDQHKADFWKKVFPKIVVHDTIAVRTGGQIAWAIRKGSPQLKAFLDGVVGAATAGPLQTQREQILARYLRRLTYVKNAATDAERRKFLSVVDLFHRYGDRYDVDWLLMAAQGYQESKLDQQARSRVGAIGVMQVMPATARDKAVNIPDIDKLDSNIHAGIKYNRWMIDNFYQEPEISRVNRALFAFASYNAGPGRVAGLRREAKAQGLDPNRWFNNVELVAAKRIGRETVTYVANIYKYYLAYQLMLRLRQERAQARQAAGKS
jgi:membrane-bound lytic murein transglycosylase MltF